MRARYLDLHDSGELAHRAAMAEAHLAACDLCARYCRVDRRKTLKGVACRTGSDAIVHSYGPHHGEERPLRGTGGSGTIFFSWCNLRCVYCQNWEISHKGEGSAVSTRELAEIMLSLQRRGCHNINFVSPSHVVAQIIAAVASAAEKGLSLPLVYNTGGFDSLEALQLLDGIVDVYMPDMKYGDPVEARHYSKVRDYVRVNQAAVGEMHRQVGDLVIKDNIAVRGLLVRHLVLPGEVAGSREIFEFLAREISTNTYLNIMAQYFPCYRANDNPPLDRRVTTAEYRDAVELAKASGLTRLDQHATR